MNVIPQGCLGVTGNGILPAIVGITYRNFSIAYIIDRVVTVGIYQIISRYCHHFEGRFKFGIVLCLIHPIPLFQTSDIHLCRHPNRKSAFICDHGWTVHAGIYFFVYGYYSASNFYFQGYFFFFQW